MNTTNDFAVLVDNLAGHWTEPVLKILKGAGIPITVDSEVAAWRVLKSVLRAELRWQRSLRLSTLVSMSALMAQTLREAARLLAQKFSPHSISYELNSRISALARERGPTALERGLYSDIVGRPALRAMFKEPTRTDFVPRLRVLTESANVAAYAAI